mmetsp:Transcript_19444/g.36393  ORF Transcript_19444/g.36393 Transcript_19444/m.36393 type:complete len:254 (-) Transcript_19444:611-1372(-)
MGVAPRPKMRSVTKCRRDGWVARHQYAVGGNGRVLRRSSLQRRLRLQVRRERIRPVRPRPGGRERRDGRRNRRSLLSAGGRSFRYGRVHVPESQRRGRRLHQGRRRKVRKESTVRHPGRAGLRIPQESRPGVRRVRRRPDVRRSVRLQVRRNGVHAVRRGRRRKSRRPTDVGGRSVGRRVHVPAPTPAVRAVRRDQVRKSPSVRDGGRIRLPLLEKPPGRLGQMRRGRRVRRRLRLQVRRKGVHAVRQGRATG